MTKTDGRDALDFGTMHVPRLFGRLFVPTLLGLISSVLLNLADGIFVGRGVGSDALAAVNIAAPMFQIATGIALMMGSGVSVVAALHLSHGNDKAARINVTQALTVGLLLMAAIVFLVTLFPHATASLFGGSERLFPLVRQYLWGVAPCMLFMVVNIVGMFVIRLDGAPNYAMAVNMVGAALNIGLDYLFVFPLKMGVFGAAIATSIASGVGTLLVLWHFMRRSRRLSLYRPKFTRTAMLLTARNCSYMLRLGLPTFVAETAISCMMVTGNYAFMARLHEEGVAAFSVACYLFPMIFMFGNAIAQSSLPIVSYNLGLGNRRRVVQTLRLTVGLGFGLGLAMTVGGYCAAPAIVGLFLDQGTAAAIGRAGVPLFLLSCLPFTLNVVLIGFLQSLERYRPASLFMLLRGYILVVPAFMLLPHVAGTVGLWIAQPVVEAVTLVFLVVFMAVQRRSILPVVGIPVPSR